MTQSAFDLRPPKIKLAQVKEKESLNFFSIEVSALNSHLLSELFKRVGVLYIHSKKSRTLICREVYDEYIISY